MPDAFIAGGAAACLSRASDIDVWVTVPELNSLSGVRNELLAWFGAQRFTYQASVERTVDENVSLGYSLMEHGELFLDNRQVGTVKGYNDGAFPKPYHIIVTNGSVDDVLSGFDISTHQIALTPKGIVKGSGWTALDVAPVVLHNTPHTPERFDKIVSRYADLRHAAAQHAA